jgi:glycosyltransferase involved in cell wall biosynthesis
VRIGLLAPPVESVPPTRYGGTERVVTWLAEALQARGHEVVVFASGDSTVDAPLVPTVERALWRDDRYATDLLPFWTLVVGRAYARAAGLDLMHNHLDYFAFSTARFAPLPTVTTLHGRLDLPELAPLYAEYSDLELVSISDAQRAPLPQARWVATVYHGMPRDLLLPSYRRGSYLAFCGRIAPEKGLDRAIEIAIAAGIPLKIAARLPLADRLGGEADRGYYESCVRPFLDHPLIEYVGELGDREKETFLQNALALLFPIAWPEPFGLVQIEALACGTPILARPLGSVREIVEPGVTGYLCDTTAEFVRALEDVGRLDRRQCRASFERRFTSAVMAARYERVYERVVGAAVEVREAPAAQPSGAVSV